MNECWPALAMMVEGIHIKDIFELVPLVLSLIISWTFRILTHEEDFLSVELKQTNSGTPVLVTIGMMMGCTHAAGFSTFRKCHLKWLLGEPFKKSMWGSKYLEN